MHPVGLDFISVTYDEDGQTKRLFFSPYESWFGLPSTFNRIVAEWFAAIRAAVVDATGREPGNTPADQLGVPPGSKALFALLLLPLILGGTLVLAVLRSDTGDAAIRPFLGGALAIILGVLGFGFLALVLGRVFGDGSSRGSGGSPRQASWLPPIVLVGRHGGQAVIHWPGVLLIFDGSGPRGGGSDGRILGPDWEDHWSPWALCSSDAVVLTASLHSPSAERRPWSS